MHHDSCKMNGTARQSRIWRAISSSSQVISDYAEGENGDGEKVAAEVRSTSECPGDGLVMILCRGGSCPSGRCLGGTAIVGVQTVLSDDVPEERVEYDGADAYPERWLGQIDKVAVRVQHFWRGPVEMGIDFELNRATRSPRVAPVVLIHFLPWSPSPQAVSVAGTIAHKRKGRLASYRSQGLVDCLRVYTERAGKYCLTSPRHLEFKVRFLRHILA